MTMLMKLSAFWLIMSVTTVAVLSYFISLMFNGVFGKDGFGTIGNMIVLTAGFFGGIIVAEYLGYSFRGLQMNVYLGLGSAFLTFTVLALLRMMIDRFVR